MVNEYMQVFENKLKAEGHRLTRARSVTFELLLSAGGPLSMGQLISAADGRIDRVSMYRNIDLFEKLGIVHKVYLGWKYKIELSELFVSHHHHMKCLTCNHSVEIDDHTDIDVMIDTLCEKYHFTPKRHQFEIDGICAKCQSKDTANTVK